MNSNFSDLLSLFNRYSVRYLVAGGYAVMYYTEPRYTKDLDVVIGLTEDDVARASQALAEFGFPLTDAQIDDLRQPNKMIVLGRPPVRIDILNEISGVDFDAAYEKRQPVVLSGETCWFISLEDLISAKRAAGRPQDLIDLQALEKEARHRKS